MRLEATTRTVRNDIKRPQILGDEVHSSTGVAGGYRLALGSVLPPFLFDDDEVVAVAVGLAAAVAGSVTGIEETSRRAMAKLEQILPTRLRTHVDALRRAIVSATGRGPTVDAGILAAAAGACATTTVYASTTPSEMARQASDVLSLISWSTQAYTGIYLQGIAAVKTGGLFAPTASTLPRRLIRGSHRKTLYGSCSPRTARGRLAGLVKSGPCPVSWLVAGAR